MYVLHSCEVRALVLNTAYEVDLKHLARNITPVIILRIELTPYVPNFYDDRIHFREPIPFM
jgi:hypothetical protein